MFRLSFSSFWLIFLTLFTLVPAFAQPFPERASLHGLVVDQDGKPIPGVFIAVRRQNDMGSYGFWGGEAQTDATGHWSMPDAEEGAYYLNAELQGYAPQMNIGFDWKKSNPAFRVQMVRMVKLKLKFTGTDGSVLSNSPVFVYVMGDGNGPNQQSGRTDANGDLTVGDYAPGTYRLYASAADGFYLNTALELRTSSSGEAMGVMLQKGATLRAKIADANGSAIGGATFSLIPATNELSGQNNTPLTMVADNFALLGASGDQTKLASHDGDGLIQLLNLPPGKYTARFVAPGLSANGNETGDHAIRTVQLRSGETTEVVWTSTPKRYGTLVLDVRTRDDKPYTGSDIIVRLLSVSGDGSIFGNNEEGENSFPGAGSTRRATPDAQGRAKFYPLRSGRYRLFVSKDSPASSARGIGGGSPVGAAPETGPIDVTIPVGNTPNGGSNSATVVLE